MWQPAVVLMSLFGIGCGEFSCICNYNIEKAVFKTPNSESSPLGYLYEFDCKPMAPEGQGLLDSGFVAIQFEHVIAYIEDDVQTQSQMCPGEISQSDLVTTTLGPLEQSNPSSMSSSSVERTTVPTSSSSNIFSSVSSASSVTSSVSTSKSTSPVSTAGATPATEKPEITNTTAAVTSETNSTTTFMAVTFFTSTTADSLTTAAVTSPVQTSTPQSNPTTNTTVTTASTTPTTTTVASTTLQSTTKTTTTNPTTPMKTTKPATTVPTSTSTESTPITTTVASTTPTTTTTVATTQSTTTASTSITTSSATPTTTTTVATTTTSTPITTTTAFDPWSNAIDVSGTPFQYVGVGYNVLVGNPELSKDPGFLLNQRVLQITGDIKNVREASFDEFTTCNDEIRNYIVHGAKSLQTEMKQFVILSSSHSESLQNSAFTNNTDFHSKEIELSYDKIYQDTTTTCKYENVKYNIGLAALSNFTVTREFATAVCQLPFDLTGSEANYYSFFDTWGTSVVISADVGVKTLTRTVSSMESFYQYLQTTDTDLLAEDGSVAGYSTSWILDEQGYQTNPVPKNPSGADIITTVGSHLDYKPIKIIVVPIFEFVESDYFRMARDTLTAEGVCSDKIYEDGLSLLAQNLNKSLVQYGSKHRQITPEPPIQFPVTWPTGTYGLMKTATGCPSGNVAWQSGFRHYDTEDVNPKNDFSSDIEHYLAGSFGKNIRTEFCMKTTSTVSKYDLEWPEGAYCILKKGSCPNGFQEGWLYWDDEDVSNGNDVGGTVPDGSYDSNTKMYYCCRSDGSPTTPIVLPLDQPFVLIRYSSTCQTVHGTSWKDVFVRWDDDDTFNKDDRGGMHPQDDESNHNHKLHFCYYHAGQRR